LRKLLLSLCFTLTATLASLSHAGIVVGSFNVHNLGWGESKRYDKLAHVAQHFDLLALQEVMSEEGLERLVSKMEQASGEEWGVMASHAIGRGSYREMYAFVWRERAVEYAGGAVVYIDARDQFAREPFLASFRSRHTGESLAIANVHILFGNSVGDRLPEIQALADIWEWMTEVYPDTPRIIAGDFNLPPHHAAWQTLRDQGAVPAVTQGATTLSTTRQGYANLYDNLWKEAGAFAVAERGILDYPAVLGLDFQQARSVVSDHAPVYVVLEGAQLELIPFQQVRFDTVQPAANEPAFDCLDLNHGTLEQLQQIPHIGPARAQEIIDGRPWQSVSSLSALSGIGPARLADIHKSGIVCEE